MKKLEEQIKTNGTTYTLVKRNAWKAIYRAEAGHYEVFKIKVLPATEIFGNPVPIREHYPSSEEFGKFAWCFTNEEKALELYDRLVEPEKKKE